MKRADDADLRDELVEYLGVVGHCQPTLSDIMPTSIAPAITEGPRW